MTLDEARSNIGRAVVYTPRHGAREDGVIERVNDRWAFVRYGNSVKATDPADLELLIARPD